MFLGFNHDHENAVRTSRCIIHWGFSYLTIEVSDKQSFNRTFFVVSSMNTQILQHEFLLSHTHSLHSHSPRTEPTSTPLTCAHCHSLRADHRPSRCRFPCNSTSHCSLHEYGARSAGKYSSECEGLCLSADSYRQAQ